MVRYLRGAIVNIFDIDVSFQLTDIQRIVVDA